MTSTATAHYSIITRSVEVNSYLLGTVLGSVAFAILFVLVACLGCCYLRKNRLNTAIYRDPGLEAGVNPKPSVPEDEEKWASQRVTLREPETAA